MFRYSLKSLLSKKIISILFIIAISIAISISMIAINVSNQIEEGFFQSDKKYDIIIGAKGSDTQLVMSGLFFSDEPLGTIDADYLNSKLKDYQLKTIVPIAMADSYNGNKLIGTTTELLKDYKLEQGRLFSKEFEIVIGSNIAKRYNLKIGDKLITSHGASGLVENHENTPYTLVGILSTSNSAYDNTCFTTLESVWDAHESHELTASEEYRENHELSKNDIEHETEEHVHEEAYTAVLIRTGNIAVANKLESDLNDDLRIQAISSTKVLRKLVKNIDMSKEVALLLCSIIILLAMILTSVMSFLMLTNSKKDIKLLNFLGMNKGKIYGYIIYQVFTLIFISEVIALVINRLGLRAVNKLSSPLGIVLDMTKMYSQEVFITLIYIAIIVISSIIYTFIRIKKEN